MISPEAWAVACGLGSALTWGAGDFSGGMATKKGGVLTVILFSQIIGGILLAGMVVCMGMGAPVLKHAAWGSLAGLWGAMGLVALYKGLASGRMGIVAPLSAVATALVPVIFAYVVEGRPRGTQIAGFGGAVAAVWLLTATGGRLRMIRKELILSLSAGMGFGLFFICIDRVSDEAILWPLVSARITSISVIALILSVRRKLALPAKGQFFHIAAAGILDTAGNTFFALASQFGRLDVAVMLTSLYPASTVLLARCVLKERLRTRQWAGLLAACLAIAMIAY